MATITITLPDDVMPRVREEAAARGFDSVESYLVGLIVEDLRRRDQELLEATLLERLDSGRWVEMTDADFRRIGEQAAARVAAAARLKNDCATEPDRPVTREGA